MPKIVAVAVDFSDTSTVEISDTAKVIYFNEIQFFQLHLTCFVLRKFKKIIKSKNKETFSCVLPSI